MADDISVRMLWQPTLDALKKADAEVQKANMFALRQTGRAIAKDAKRRAPVLADASGKKSSVKTIKAAKKAGLRKGGDFQAVIPGLLRASIGNAKKLRKDGNTSTLLVGPLGKRVTLYRQKIEAIKPFMRPAYDSVAGQMSSIFEAAYAKAIAKYTK